MICKYPIIPQTRLHYLNIITNINVNVVNKYNSSNVCSHCGPRNTHFISIRHVSLRIGLAKGGTMQCTKVHCVHRPPKSNQRPKPAPGSRNTARPQRVTWRRRSRDQSIRNVPFPIGGPLKPSLYFQPFSRYWAQHMLTNKHTNTLTNERTRRIAIPPGGSKTPIRYDTIRYYNIGIADTDNAIISIYRPIPMSVIQQLYCRQLLLATPMHAARATSA